MAKKKILFIIGSMNQTTQMHQIERYLAEDYDCYFSQLFSSHPAFDFVIKTGVLNHTIFAGETKIKADKYLAEHGLKNDYRARVFKNNYDLVLVCTDMVLPKSLSGVKTVWIQEGMIDGYTRLAGLVKKLGLPAYLAMSTALNGSSNLCDIYCVASPAYKNYLSEKGTDKGKIAVTGIPNYDNIEQHLNNDFPHKDYVLAATSDIRETFRSDDRAAFLKKTVAIASGRPLIFKLHPNEKKGRAISEIRKYTPADTLIYTDGNTNHMIANCAELITQYSTVVYVGLALGKKVHSYFDVKELQGLMPVQNGGQSAGNIAAICRRFINYEGKGSALLGELYRERVSETVIMS